MWPLFFLESSMTKKDMEKIEVGDIIKKKNSDEMAFIVSANFGNRLTAVRSIEVREDSAKEWEIVSKRRN